MATLTFPEQNFHHLRHVNLQKHVWETQNGCDTRQDNGLHNRMLGQILLAECLNAEIPLDDKRSVQTAKNADEDKEDQLEEMPRAIVLHLKHDQLSGSKGIHCLDIY